MANEKNLLKGNPDTQFKSGPRAAEMGRKGGQRFAENLHRKKRLSEVLDTLLSLPVNDPAVRKLIKELGFDDEELDNKTAINVALFQEALKGNTKAYELIRDTLGEKPTDKLSIEEAPVIKLERPHG